MNEGATEVDLTLKKKVFAKKNTEGRAGEGDKFENFKAKITFKRIRRKCVYFSRSEFCDSARKPECWAV